MEVYIRFVLRHRLIVVAACAVVTALAILSLSRATIGTSLPQLIFGDDPRFQSYLEIAAEFASHDQLFIAYEDKTPLGDLSLARLRRVVQHIEARPEVRRIQSLLDVPPGQARAAAGLLLSYDGRAGAAIIELTEDPDRTFEGLPDLVASLVAPFETAGFEGVHIGGMVAVTAELQVQTRDNLMVLLPIGMAILLTTTWVLFRSLRPALITFLTGVLAIVWTMGLAIAIDPQVNVMLAIAPSLIMIIAFADIVHLCTAFLRAQSSGLDRTEAIVRAATEVGGACVLTSITTFLGFAGLTLMGVPAFRQLGIVMGFGVGVSLMLAVTLVPVVLSVTGARWRDASSRAVRIVEWTLAAQCNLATRRAWLVVSLGTVVLGLAIVGASRLDIETNFVDRMSQSNRVRQDADWLRANFAGDTLVDLIVTLPDPLWELSEQGVASLRAYERSLEAEQGIGRAVSILDATGQVGLARAAAGEGFLSDDGRRYRILLLLPEGAMRATHEIGERARVMAERDLPGWAVEPTGLQYLAGAWLNENVVAQFRPLVVSFVAITLVLIVAFRSIRIGLLSMIPNVLPLLAVGGVVGFFYSPVDSDAVLVGLIAIGIAVDDTIHYLWRVRLEMPRTEDATSAIRRSFDTCGRAIVMTTVIFTLGSVPFALSEYSSISILGTLVPVVMFAALGADLLLLPALLQLAGRRLWPVTTG